MCREEESTVAQAALQLQESGLAASEVMLAKAAAQVATPGAGTSTRTTAGICGSRSGVHICAGIYISAFVLAAVYGA